MFIAYSTHIYTKSYMYNENNVTYIKDFKFNSHLIPIAIGTTSYHSSTKSIPKQTKKIFIVGGNRKFSIS